MHAERNPRTIRSVDGQYAIKAHVFARNTTPLFGTSLIDQIPDSIIWQQCRQQERDREISGRPGTLGDGRLGKFGWRANFATLLEFNENACASELGMQSNRVDQPLDLTNRTYVNANPDLSDDAIEAMNAFVASLPRPQRLMPMDSRQREHVARGEQMFAAVGCAKCHTPLLANVKDFYSDMLLHDMGPYSIDMAGAPPYRTKFDVVEQVSSVASNFSTRTYYGSTTVISIPRTTNLANRSIDAPKIVRYPQ